MKKINYSKLINHGSVSLDMELHLEINKEMYKHRVNNHQIQITMFMAIGLVSKKEE